MTAQEHKLPSEGVPTGAELDVLAALWASGGGPLRLGDVHKGVVGIRRSVGEPPPATTTVSTHLRRLVTKGLIKEVSSGQPLRTPEVRTRGAPVRVRGGMSPRKTSANIGYQAIHAPGEVLASTYSDLIAAYPQEERQRWQPLADFAEAMGIPSLTIQKMLELATSDEAPEEEKRG